MKYSTLVVKNIIFFTLLMFLQACGSATEKNSVNQTFSTSQKSIVIDEDNYVKLSKYYFDRKTRVLKRTKVSRGVKLHPAYPGANNTKKHILSVKVVAPFNQYIQQMILSQDNIRVVVVVDDANNRVNISFDDTKINHSKSMTLSEFKSINKERGL